MTRPAADPVPLDEAVRAWVQRSCAAQGLPVHVGDRRVVSQVAVLLMGGGVGPPGKRSADGPTSPLTAGTEHER